MSLRRMRAHLGALAEALERRDLQRGDLGLDVVRVAQRAAQLPAGWQLLYWCAI